MKALRHSFLAATLAASAAISAFAAEDEPGYVDIGQLLPANKGEFVEVNLSPGLLKFAARIAKNQEPEAAELLADIKRVRVNVVSLDDSNRAETVEKIQAVRRKLESQGWTPMVTVREKNDGDDVAIYAKQRGEDQIDGIVVTVLERNGEAVFVNIVGKITAEKISALADKYDIKPLRHAKIRARASDKS